MLEVREEEKVRLAVDEAMEKWARAHDAWEAVTWALARDQFAGAAIDESGRVRSFVFDGARSIEMPSIDVIYSVEGGCVAIEDVRFYDAPYTQAGRT